MDQSNRTSQTLTAWTAFRSGVGVVVVVVCFFVITVRQNLEQKLGFQASLAMERIGQPLTEF